MPEQPIESTEVLASDDVYRAALVALRMWREVGRGREDWREYRDSAVAWLRLAADRLEAVQ
ncbi:hypothetical protein THIBAULT_64 [Mycobacterium phage Thibault]|uniref:Uncharacterized protein n=1 Tax=Mycobacterium phage Thibault TaxID=1052673 RepID=G1FGC9_9CAUD|nr:hypothetical protein CL87_gp064 [Mycobacterium phage Thibault]AEJ94144.1 hypothetical protein THIBAULT_64 [Mycobacterium phage Thibault]